MKKLFLLSAAIGLIAFCPTAVFAHEPTNSVPSADQPTTKTADAAKKAKQRRKLMALIGIDRAQLKGLAPADRQARIKEAADKKIAELESKQTAGTISAQDKTDLAMLKKFEQHMKAAKKTAS